MSIPERRIWTARCLEIDCQWGLEDTDYAALLTAVTKHEHRYSIEIHYRPDLKTRKQDERRDSEG